MLAFRNIKVIYLNTRENYLKRNATRFRCYIIKTAINSYN